MQLMQLQFRNKQRGASTPLILIFVGMMSVILTVGFKLYPAFYDYWLVESVMESFDEDKDLGDVSRAEIEKRFKNRLMVNNVREFNYDDSVVITTDNGLMTIELDYEVRTNIYRNIDAVVSFEKTYEKRY